MKAAPYYMTPAVNMVVAVRRLREAAVWVAEAHKIILVLPDIICELCLFQKTVLMFQASISNDCLNVSTDCFKRLS